MKKYIFLISLFTLGLMTSCDDYVDLDPKGLVIPRKIDDLNLVMQNDLELTKTGRAPVLMEDNLIIAEHVQAYIQGLGLAAGMDRIYGFEDLIYPADGFPDWDWSAYYETIGICNYVNNQIPLVTGSAAEKDGVEAEARTQRALAYFMAVNQYAKHYGAGDPNESESGVPIVSVFGDVETSLQRATIQQVYDQIISDLMFAIDNHPNLTPNYIFQGSKWAANALLSRVYLHMGNYQNALDYATTALNINNDLIDYPNELAALGGDLGNPSSEPAARVGIIMHKNSIAPYRIAFVPGSGLAGAKQFYLTQDLVALFDQANDMRYKNLTVADFASGLRRYKGADGNLLSASYGFTTSELLMIRAEANARLGNTGAAITDVNYLRAHRIDSTDPAVVNLTASTPEQAVQVVLDEKRRETMFEGVRYFDVKRLNGIEDANINLVRENFAGEIITLTANDLRWVMPIGENEILLNPEIRQNPR